MAEDWITDEVVDEQRAAPRKPTRPRDWHRAAVEAEQARDDARAQLAYEQAQRRQWEAEYRAEHAEHLATVEAERDALARRGEAVRALHTPREEQVVTGDCSIEECDHEDECPTVPFAVCAECWRVADEADTYFAERGVGHVAYPCPTVRALDEAAGS